jgi:hypothetical protein
MSFIYQLAVTAIIADPPGVAEQKIESIKQYGAKGAAFIWNLLLAHPNEFITAVATCVIAAFTVILAKSTTRLWQTTKDAIAAQARDMERSIAVAQKSAGTAEHALLRAERAFVFVDGFDLKRWGDDQFGPYYFITAWKNGGKTWTKRARNYISWLAVPPESGPPDDFPDLPSPIGTVPVTQLLIGPGNKVFGQRIEIPHNFFAAAMEGQCNIFVWGWCEYNDVFPETPRHRTEFCIKIERLVSIISDVTSGERKAEITFAIYHKHNGADEDCFKPAQT